MPTQTTELLHISALPGEVLLEIGSHLKNESDMSNLVSTSKKMYSLFQPQRLLNKFLQLIAFGEQNKAEQLFTSIYKGDKEEIQKALLHQGKFTDYSGRTFICSAYEYAYWAKDTHMCRMLERYMDNETKAIIAARIDEMERIEDTTGQAVGLVYKQEGQEHRSAHFDFTPLKEAYQRYLDNFDEWYDTQNMAAIYNAWCDVGKAQRNVPAHVAQEYCRPDRSFEPRPEFNNQTLPRVLTFKNLTSERNDSWFPLADSNSGLDFDFALIRGEWKNGAVGCPLPRAIGANAALRLNADLVAITHLDEVRTAELTLSRETPPAVSHGITM